MNSLFVYGIFLDEVMRAQYGMHSPQYATVKGYITVGDKIVQAVKVDSDKNTNIELTGLQVEVNPEYWEIIDALERGYDRIKVKTTDREEVWMYAAKQPS